MQYHHKSNLFARCPVDLYVFPELHKTPDGGLEAEFYAFKIPDSNFLVFQATVRTCRGPCESVYSPSNHTVHLPLHRQTRTQIVSEADMPINK